MNVNYRLVSRTMLWWIAGLGVVGSSAAQAACPSTPAAAVGLIGNRVENSVAGDGGGFRVTSMRWDPLLRRRWALVVSCEHPEWPAVELPVPALESAARDGERDQAKYFLPRLPVVRAGELVHLWSQEDNLRIDIGAVAEQNGAVGERVRVRLTQRNGLGNQIEEQFLGVVRGPRDVEITR